VKRIRSVVINGVPWRIQWIDLSDEGAWGMCHFEKRIIQIHDGLEDNALIAEILAHEIRHAQSPEIDEAYVDQQASEIINALQRAGLINEEDEE
jgi:hypothetical protein